MDIVMNGWEVLGVIGLMGMYIWLKVWLYRREYLNKENKETK